MTTRFRLSSVLVLTLSCVVSAKVVGEEGGVGHYMPGSVGTLIDTPPTKAGWVIEPIYLHYSGQTSLSAVFPRAGLVTAGLEAKSDAYMLGAIYTFESLVLGAHYSVGAFLPIVDMEVTGSLDTAFGGVSRTDSVSGLGDISFILAMLNTSCMGPAGRSQVRQETRVENRVDHRQERRRGWD